MLCLRLFLLFFFSCRSFRSPHDAIWRRRAWGRRYGGALQSCVYKWSGCGRRWEKAMTERMVEVWAVATCGAKLPSMVSATPTVLSNCSVHMLCALFSPVLFSPCSSTYFFISSAHSSIYRIGWSDWFIFDGL
ncbi:hypothetical protein BDZ97DRAFT_264505 [Flammula alnicola]|nr:hypothetical protein BDZ97DRAFT_264505 [Flammula alnicola]